MHTISFILWCAKSFEMWLKCASEFNGLILGYELKSFSNSIWFVPSECLSSCRNTCTQWLFLPWLRNWDQFYWHRRTLYKQIKTKPMACLSLHKCSRIFLSIHFSIWRAHTIKPRIFFLSFPAWFQHAIGYYIRWHTLGRKNGIVTDCVISFEFRLFTLWIKSWANKWSELPLMLSV